MKPLSHDAYLAMRADAEVLEANQRGDKVLKLADGSYLKLFRRKRLLSSAAWYPYAKRFADNAAQLERRHIPAPRVIGVYRIASIARDGVHYHPLAGRTLRQLIASGLDPASEKQLKHAFNRFVICLHDEGVYFRSLHLGNVVLTPDETFGLIDIADLRAYERPLREALRARNLRRMQAMPDECDWVDHALLLDPAARRGVASAV